MNIFLNKNLNSNLKGRTLLLVLFAMINLVGFSQTIYVNDNSRTGDVYTSAVGNDVSGNGTAALPYATITKAITVATAGTSIRVDAGTYTGNIAVNKNVTLMGANFGTFGTSSRVAESIISSGKITVSGSGAVILDGFYVLQTSALNGATIDIGNTPTIVRNNIIERNFANTGITPVGVQTASGATAAISIYRNLFTGNASLGLFSSHRTWNSGIYSNGGSAILIEYNTFQNCRTAINSDNMSSGVTISNNTFGTNGTHISFGGSSATSGSHTLSGNTFSVTVGYTTINLSNVTTSFKLDITNSTIGSTAAASMSLTQCFSFESTIIHKGASSKNGLVTFVSGKLFKGSTTTLANNITYATAGDIIHVASGTVAETVNINKSLKLYGNNYTVNPNDGSWAYNSSRATETVITGAGITIAASNVEVKGFKLTSITSGGTAIGNTNPSSTYSGIEISNNWITNTSNVHPIWFTASNGNPFSAVTVSNNRLETNTTTSVSNMISGIDLWRCSGSAITGNYVNGATYNGIKNDGFGTALITGNRLVGCKVAGISIQSTYANGQIVIAASNTISGCQEGIAVWSSTTDYSTIKFQLNNNTITVDAGKLDVNYPAIYVQNITSNDNSYTNQINGNTVTYSGTFGSAPFGVISGGPASASYGLSLVGSLGKLDVQNNVFDGGNVAALNLSNANYDMAAIYVSAAIPVSYSSGGGNVTTNLAGTIRVLNNDMKNFKNGLVCYDFINNTLGNIPSGVSLTVNDNSIVPGTGGKAFIAGSAGSGIAGTCNWYGSSDYTVVTSKVTGNVTYVSFLVNGTDDNLGATGFQPVTGVCTGAGVVEPSLGASAAVYSLISQTNVSFSFTKGNGTKRIVVAKAGSAISSNPVNNTSYTASATYGSGNQIGGGYVVLNDTGRVVSVSGLQANTTYYFSVYEYNYLDAVINYAGSLVYNTSVTTPQPDADADGVPDAEDEYPTDQYKAFNNRYPAANFGTLLFEDLWPAVGDYDFNDLVVDYRFNTITDANNEVVEVAYNFVTRAIGGGLHNGFAFQLDGINPNKITSVTGSKAAGAAWISVSSNGTEAGQGSNANILVFDDAYELLPTQIGHSFVNVSAGAPDSGKDTTQIVVKFKVNGALPSGGAQNFSSFGSSLFNPYLILGQNRGKEVHLINRVPSAKVNSSFFGTDDDRTVPASGAYYKTAQNLPWAINISTTIPYPLEKIDISAAYLKFIEWAQSGGTLQTTWYLNDTGKRDITKLWPH
ncbi:MAG: hypothetical protein CFE21_04175 [Bacteroidetes bacterium B1(2017)]|nr:MAG: hypothetical protein CFE21_04175 [Bacteroidetes bacterium B1(2017)]